jgi:thermostable 8-oxoguanine DNA glycosylase
MSLETKRKSEIDREIRELQHRFQNERSQLEMEIRRAKESMERKNREGEDMSLRINQLTKKIN